MAFLRRLFGLNTTSPRKNAAPLAPNIVVAVAELETHLVRMASAVAADFQSIQTNSFRATHAEFEVLYAYLNYADRSFFGLFGPAVRKRALEVIEGSLPQRITAAFCGGWPEPLQKKHVAEFLVNMRNGEQEYGLCKPTGLPRQDDVFMRCAINALEDLGHSEDSSKALSLCLKLMSVYVEMPMAPYVEKLGKALMNSST